MKISWIATVIFFLLGAVSSVTAMEDGAVSAETSMVEESEPVLDESSIQMIIGYIKNSFAKAEAEGWVDKVGIKFGKYEFDMTDMSGLLEVTEYFQPLILMFTSESGQLTTGDDGAGEQVAVIADTTGVTSPEMTRLLKEFETAIDEVATGDSRRREQRGVRGVRALEDDTRALQGLAEFLPDCSPFEVERFEEGSCDGGKSKKRFKGPSKSLRKFLSGKKGKCGGKSKKSKSSKGSDEINRYAWGADCARQDDGTVCVMAHSGGTPAAFDEARPKPVITIRSGTGNEAVGFEDQEVIARVELEDEALGLRAANVWKIHRDNCGFIESIDIIFGEFASQTSSSLNLYTVEVESRRKHGSEGCEVSSRGKKSSSKNKIKCDPNKVTKKVLIEDDPPVPGVSSSIRALRDLKCGDDTNAVDVVVFARWSDSLGFNLITRLQTTLSPSLFVYNPDFPEQDPVEVRLTQADSKSRQVWDFEIDETNGLVYYNTAQVTFTDTDGGLDIIPELFVGPTADLCSAVEELGTATTYDAPIESFTFFQKVNSTNIGSLGSLQPLPDSKQVLYCSMSGFVYEAFFGTEGVEQLELGIPQSCYVCNADDGTCQDPEELPSQNGLSAYIWDLTICDNKVFAGTLDLTGLVVNLILREIISFLEETDIGILCRLNLDNPILLFLLEIFVFFIVSLILQQPFNIAQGGFNLLYVDVDDVTDLAKWKVVTKDGFRRILNDDDNEIRVDPEFFYEEGVLGYLRNRPFEDGVRNMVCSDDHFLHVGTAVYGDSPSNTYIVDLRPDEPRDGTCEDAERFFLE